MAPTKGIHRPVTRVLDLLTKAGIPTTETELARSAPAAAWVITQREVSAIVRELKAIDASSGTQDAARRKRPAKRSPVKSVRSAGLRRTGEKRGKATR